MYKILFPLCLICFFSVAHANESDMPFPVGIVKYDKSGVFISTPKKQLRNDLLSICSQKDKLCTSVPGDRFFDEKESEDVEDIALGSEGRTYYSSGGKLQENIDIAIIHSKSSTDAFNVKFNDKNNITVSVNSKKYTIFMCTGSEWIHVYSTLKDIHLYYSLGYGVIANCAEEVYK